MDLQNNNRCFVCGKENESGLKLDLEVVENKLVADVIFDEKFQGFKDIIHGGIVGTVLDEMMVNLSIHLGFTAVTAEIKIRLKKPTLAGVKYKFVGEITGEKKKTLIAKAWSYDTSGDVVAEADGILIKI